MPTPPAEWVDCGTTLVYRNIVLANCQTHEFSQSAEMDESHVDLLFQKFRVSVTGYIHEQDLTGFGVYTDDAGHVGIGSPAAPVAVNTAKRLHQWMMHPRGDLHFYMEGNEILSSLGVEALGITGGVRDEVDVTSFAEMSAYDVHHGPIPISCNVDYIAGYKSFRIRFTIETCKTLCDQDLIGQNTASNPDIPVGDGVQSDFKVLSNRWSIQETRNADFKMTSVFTGTLRVRAYTQWAHTFRNLCLPFQRRGFQRKRMTFMQSPDGLTLKYTIHDEQRYAAPPSPAIDWRGTQTEQIQGFGHIGVSTVSIWLLGAIGTPKSKLLNAAIATIDHRLGDLRNNGADAEQIIPIYAVLTDTLHDNQIKLDVSIKRVPDSTLKWANIMFDSVGRLPAVNANFAVPEGGDEADRNDAERNDNDPASLDQYNRDKWPTPLAYDGDAPAGMFATYLQSPCVGYHSIPNSPADEPRGTYPGIDTNPQPTPTIKVYELEDTAEDISPDDPADSQLSQDHIDFQYTHYDIESKYVTDRGIQAIPYAAPQANPSADQVCVARISHPLTYRDVWIRASRSHEMPAIPEAPDQTTDENGITETLVCDSIVPMAPTLMTNGQQYEQKIECFYRYVLSRTPRPDEKLRAGSLPWDITTPSDNTVVLADSQTNTII